MTTGDTLWYDKDLRLCEPMQPDYACVDLTRIPGYNTAPCSMNMQSKVWDIRAHAVGVCMFVFAVKVWT